eukprot:CAMPEP_0113657782 /NCGR_PEP_ID=MMETSP0017_2-20120614/31287_1 /TAXON_ID=2856 /ORGANISM="Cylindrotheca closterium" /LENGTH=401 /DNA_ID=CAMNT_0000571847 /DNA_START=201 /DNA_END=1407 /DNA_ORIENTATION=+ /assembly_acc=CAM_ASM_000147
MKRDSFSSFSSSLDQLSILSTSTTRERSRSPSPPPSSSGDPVLFFPVVNNLVRKRRNIRTTSLQPAFLDGYRLSFEFGGIANVVRARGYRVHGVLMTLASLRDLKKMQSYDIRRQVTQRLVFHYPKNGFIVDEDASDEEEKEELESAMAYFIEYPEDAAETQLQNDPAIERLPQEGYLKLIAEGMQQNRVCYEYIEDSIFNIPYTPDRPVSDYQKFPLAPKVAKISFLTYQDLCDTANGDIYFVLGTSVFMLGSHNPNNPLAKWLEEHGHGRDDVTFFVQIVLMNPALSFCKRRSEVTPTHIEWAENQLVETTQQHGLEAKKVFEFIKDDESEDGPSKFFTLEEEDNKEYVVRPSALADGGDFSDKTMATSNLDHAGFSPKDSTKKRFKVTSLFKRIVNRR